MSRWPREVRSAAAPERVGSAAGGIDTHRGWGEFILLGDAEDTLSGVKAGKEKVVQRAWRIKPGPSFPFQTNIIT